MLSYRITSILPVSFVFIKATSNNSSLPQEYIGRAIRNIKVIEQAYANVRKIIEVNMRLSDFSLCKWVPAGIYRSRLRKPSALN